MRIATFLRASALVLCVVLAGCGRGGDENLWKMDFPADKATITPTQLDGYWEGDVFAGGIRLRVEPERMTIAMRCDGDGKKLSQGTARVVVERDTPTKIVLQEDLAGGDADCGFKFLKGDTFAYGLDGRGLLQIAFAGASVSRLTKLADLPAK